MNDDEIDCIFFWDGRLNRKKYVLINIIIFLITALVSYIAYLSCEMSNFVIYFLICFIYYCLIYWIVTAAQIKRLHDRNKSAAWILVYYTSLLVLLVLAIVIYKFRKDGKFYYHLLGLTSIPILGLLWFFIETFFIRGTHGDNKYGVDPLIKISFKENCYRG